MEKTVEQLVKDFINSNDAPRYLFGANPKAKQIIEAAPCKISGVIDEVTKSDGFCGLPVIHSLDELETNAIIVSCVHSCYPKTIMKKLRASGLMAIDLFSFMKYSGVKVDIESWVGFKESYENNKTAYENIYSRLIDYESKDTWERIIKYRLDMDFSQMEIFSVKTDQQYFEPFLNLKTKGEVFVDVGGYDGFSSIQFIKQCPQYDSILFFEPEPVIMEEAKKRLKGESVFFYEYAASDRPQKLRFSSNAAASIISEAGDLVINAETIDNIVASKKVTYIKMDIEGSEAAAIEGAKNTILKNYPLLAICVYHKTADLIDLPKQVLSIRDDYDLYLRHYTEGTQDTVMYFVPKK